jgi:hypothetical protein
MEETQYEPEMMTGRALIELGCFEEYDPRAVYSNPAKNAKFGMSMNWMNHLAPDNVVNMIAQGDTLAQGLAEAAEATLENTLNHRYMNDARYTESQKDDWTRGIVQELSFRAGFGAFAEIWWSQHDDIAGTVVEPEDGDEDAGIDVRTTETTYQVKVGESFKSGWSKKEADHLVWVKADDYELTGYEIR